MPWRLLAGPWGRPSSGISTWRLRRRTSSRRAVCVFQGFREEQLEEKKTIFFKVWSPSPSPLRGWNCDPSRKRILHVPQALDPETQKKTPPFLRRVRRRRPPAGCSSNLWSSWVFKKKKAGKGNVEVNEVEVSQMSRSRKKEQNVTFVPPSIATLSADSYSYLLLPGDLRRRTPVPEEWRGLVKKRESKGRHVGRGNAAGTWSASYFGGSASSSSNCRRLCCFRWPALSCKSRASQI